MRIGLTAYDVPAAELVALARAADEAGFDSLWLGEHVLLPIGDRTAHPSTQQDHVQHHSGPIVQPDTELVEAWVLAESLLAGRAARHPDAALRRERRQPHLGSSTGDEPLEEYVQSHAAFHVAVGSLARNRVLELSLLTAGLIVSHHVPVAYDPRTLREEMEQEHHDIAAAIIAGRPARAEALMRQHIQRIADITTAAMGPHVEDYIEWD